MPDDAQERRLRAEKTEWANMATVARLELDAARKENLNLQRELSYLRNQNRRLRGVYEAANALMYSKTWAASDLSGLQAGPVLRLRDALSNFDPGTARRARDTPLGVRFGASGVTEQSSSPDTV